MVEPNARDRMRSLFDRARLPMSTARMRDANGHPVIEDGWGGMLEGDGVEIVVKRAFTDTDLTHLAQETRGGEPLLIFRHTLALPIPDYTLTRAQALAHVSMVVRDRRVLFIESRYGAGSLHPLVVLPRSQVDCVVFGSWASVEALIELEIPLPRRPVYR